MLVKNLIDSIGNRTLLFPACNAVPHQPCYRVAQDVVKTHKYWQIQNYRNRINENKRVNGAAIDKINGQGEKARRVDTFRAQNYNLSPEQRNTEYMFLT
jgi:hypothetical protein